MTYREASRYLESFINYEKIPVFPYKQLLKLERIKDFLYTINNPQDSLRCIHIAGTKGKGSTCAFIAYILRQAGYKVGLYTSPHLSDFRERIRILTPRPTLRAPSFDTFGGVQTPPFRAGKEYAALSINPEQASGFSPRCWRIDFEGTIPKKKLTGLAEKLKPAIRKYNKNSEYGPLTFFEVYTALAFIYFKEQKVDFAVLETGLGGRLDATNVVRPLVCALTPISYEHTQKLGNTLREIATEKTGIIKAPLPTPHSPRPIVICAPQEKEVMEVIKNRCKNLGVKLYLVGKDIKYKKTKDAFQVKGLLNEYRNLNIRLIGSHQLTNAAVSIGVIESLRLNNINVSRGQISKGLYNTLWPGRCEVVSRNPLVLLDGAQNVASSRALKEAVKENFSAKGGSASGGKYKRLILVLGISQDKDIKGICNELYDLADEVILTKANNPRATEPEVLAGYFNGKDTHITGNVKEAKAKALHIANKEDLILVCGSLFVVGEFRNDKI